jgi:hypothetical protein
LLLFPFPSQRSLSWLDLTRNPNPTGLSSLQQALEMAAAAEGRTGEPAANGDKPAEEPQQFDPSRSKGPLLSDCLCFVRSSLYLASVHCPRADAVILDSAYIC